MEKEKKVTKCWFEKQTKPGRVFCKLKVHCQKLGILCQTNGTNKQNLTLNKRNQYYDHK